IGALETKLSSIDVRISMGKTTLGATAGYLAIQEDSPVSTLGTPAGLKYNFLADRIDPIFTNGALTQVNAPEGLAEIVTNNSINYRIDFYTPANVSAKTNNAYPHTGSPFVTITIEYPGGDTNQLQ